MSQEQTGQIIDSSEYYVRREAEKLRQKFPHLADFLSIAPPDAEEAAAGIVSTPVKSAAAATDGGSALSALQRLKAKLQAMQNKEEPAADAGQTQDTAADEVPAMDNGTKIAEIESRECSLREKVQLLNKFAAGFFVSDDYSSAAEFLTAALKIDAYDNQTLKNMALTQAALGNSDKAQAFAANLQEADFLLLQLLKDWKNG